ncbi:MAG: hypothetical protein V7711_05690 [Pseudomonadales bacterium]
MNRSVLWHYALSILIVVAVAIAWSGVIDQLSADYVGASITDAGIIFGTARGLNAVVSVAQGTELNLPFLTLALGEVLDPVNDLIERFSAVMVFVLGSVMLQKILLVLAASNAFNILFSLIGLALVGASFKFGAASDSKVLRFFLLACFFRFSLAFVAMANAYVDYQFLEGSESASHESMKEYQQMVREVNQISGGLGSHQEEIAALRSKMAFANGKIGAVQAELGVLLKKKSELDVSREKQCSDLPLPFCQPYPGSEKPELLAQTERDLFRIEDAIARKENSIQDLKASIEVDEEGLVCLQKRQGGGKCSVFEYLDPTDIRDRLQQKIEQLNGRTAEFVDSAMSLLMALLLKSVLIPLAFFYLLLCLVRLAFKSLSNAATE